MSKWPGTNDFSLNIVGYNHKVSKNAKVNEKLGTKVLIRLFMLQQDIMLNHNPKQPKPNTNVTQLPFWEPQDKV